jgi:hypothetical protein
MCDHMTDEDDAAAMEAIDSRDVEDEAGKNLERRGPPLPHRDDMLSHDIKELLL